jgi:hypothetical protein
MLTSLFLAKALGLYLLITGVGLISNRKRMRGLLVGFLENEAIFYTGGLIALVLGILMVVNHNIWNTGWQAIISLLAWLTLLKGAARIVVPGDKYRTWIIKMNLNEKKYLFFGVLSVVLGAYLAYIGFYF